MIIAINYANAAYKKQQRLNTKTAYLFGKVDKVYSFSPEDIDKNFYEQNKNILSYKRGGGCWLWKPYIILSVLAQIQFGDYLIYVDSGAFYIRNIRKLIQKMDDAKQDIFITETPLIECQWTKKMTFEKMDAYNELIRYSNQIMSGFIIVKKTEQSISFIKKWFDLCQDADILIPKEKDDYEDYMYIAHREDQSILSILAKKEGIIPFSDPSDYGKFPNQYLSKKRLFRINRKDKDYNIEKPFFLLSRKVNPVLYVIVYFVKNILNSIGLRKLNYE
jgi:hypothetical protein